jgi:hypothetical protein
MKHDLEFDGSVDMEQVRNFWKLSVVAAESIHGRVKVQMTGQFQFEVKGRKAFTISTNPLDQFIFFIFIGYLMTQIGEKNFSVKAAAPIVPMQKPDGSH